VQILLHLLGLHISDEIKRYILKVVYATREPKEYNIDEFAQYIKSGVSPRGSIDLYRASRAYAYIRGRDYVTPADVAKSAHLVITHRLQLNYKAKANSISKKQVVEQILRAIPIP